MGKTEQAIARFIVETARRDVPGDALASAKLGTFDCIGTMLAGAASQPGRLMANYVRAAGGTPESTVLGIGHKTNAATAALANGTFAHAIDYDDFGPMGHPSCVLVPALISLGDRRGCCGMDILDAYAIGLEVGHSISAACRYSQPERSFHVTSMYGPMAATAACARLLKLDVRETVMAFGLVGSTVGGLAQNFGTYTKGLHAGLPGQNAVLACLLAADGWKAADDIFEGSAGYLAAYTGRGNYDLEAISASLGKWHARNDITIKKYPNCARNHNTLDSLFALMKEHNVAFDDIERVDVEGLPRASSALIYADPAYGFQGKFSLRYNVATALIDGHIDVDSYSDDRIGRPRLREALAKVNIHTMLPHEPGYDSRSAENPVTVTLKDGRKLRKATNLFTMHGSPADPLSQDEVFAKFRSSAGLVLPASSVEQACEAWWRLDSMQNIASGLNLVSGHIT